MNTNIGYAYLWSWTKNPHSKCYTTFLSLQRSSSYDFTSRSRDFQRNLSETATNLSANFKFMMPSTSRHRRLKFNGLICNYFKRIWAKQKQIFTALFTVTDTQVRVRSGHPRASTLRPHYHLSHFILAQKTIGSRLIDFITTLWSWICKENRSFSIISWIKSARTWSAILLDNEKKFLVLPCQLPWFMYCIHSLWLPCAQTWTHKKLLNIWKNYV